MSRILDASAHVLPDSGRTPPGCLPDPGDSKSDDTLANFEVLAQAAIDRAAIKAAKGSGHRELRMTDREVLAESVGNRVKVSVHLSVDLMLPAYEVDDVDDGIATISCYLTNLLSGME